MTFVELDDATWAAGILALGGASCGGAVVDESAAENFIAALVKASAQPLKAAPSSLSSEALKGTLDLAATLALGKPVRAPGLLQDDHEAHLLVRRADRLDATSCFHMAAAIDRGELLLVAVTDFADPDAQFAATLADRIALRVSGQARPHWLPKDMVRAQQLLSNVPIAAEQLAGLCAAALAIGIASPRTVIQSLHVARLVAALGGSVVVDDAAITIAARLVLAHRAQHAPAQETDKKEPSPSPPDNAPNDDGSDKEQRSEPTQSDVILEAVKAALPANMLQFAADGIGKRGAGRNAQNKAASKKAAQRGRRIGSRRSSALTRQRLDVIATLRNAAPWQPLRRKLAGLERMIVTRDDFQVFRIKQRNEATAIFGVDASGSTAFQRLAEAKGAVEAILAECYVRRDRVALVSFRGKIAEILLPPTRSLERAKRALAALPGGGGTPLAAGLDQVMIIAEQVKRAGGSPVAVILTDGRANVTRAGEGNKAKALEETQAAARLFAAEGYEAMVIDVSQEPQKHARTLADAMGAKYIAMPRAQAADIARPVAAALRSKSG